MRRRFWLILVLLAAAPVLRGQDDLPKRSSGEPLDFEPKLMLDGPRVDPSLASPAPSPAESVTECEAALTQAEGRAADSEQLYKEGILAKVEVEERMDAVVKATKDLAEAKLSAAVANADAVKKSFDAHNASQPDLDAANAVLKTAQDAEATAAAAWERAEITAATLDLERKRKLYSEGVGSRREVELAEDRLALVSGSAVAK